MKKRLLLHACCAPCSIAIIDELKDDYDISIFFYNPNVHPKKEYEERKKYVQQICNEFNVLMIEGEYDVENWFKKMKGLEKEPEGGLRCNKCFAMRLEKTAQYASKHKFDIFASSLTTGRNKKASIINPLGYEFAKKYGIKFLDIDWKKGGRQEKSIKMAKERGIYRQNYCGCIFSLQERIEWEKKKTKIIK